MYSSTPYYGKCVFTLPQVVFVHLLKMPCLPTERTITMSQTEIINAWKSEPEDRMTNVPANPVGEELTDEELATIEGGLQIAISGLVCGYQTLVDNRPLSPFSN